MSPNRKDDQSDSGSDASGSFETESISSHELAQNAEAEKIAADPSLSDAAKIDALAKTRSWFEGDTTLISAYLSNEIPASEVVDKIAGPIDESYTTADHGEALWQAEEDARHQRELCDTPEEAMEIWGPEEDFPEPDEKMDDDEESAGNTTEGKLWDLWYGVLHAAKRIPWDDEAQQTKLVDLVKAFKARPDPPPPAKITKALKTDWIWEPGTLWSELLLFGPAAREAWNDAPGFGSGFTAVEGRAWMNVNAFVARLTASGVENFENYGMWALRDALEDSKAGEHLQHEPPKAERRSCFIKVAAVWVFVAGRYMYGRRKVEEGGDKGEEISLESEDEERFPWKENSDEVTDSRWTFWRRMFEKVSKEEEYAQESREMAAKAAKEIAGFQGK